MIKKPCGNATKQFIRDYAPNIQRIECTFAYESAMKQAIYMLNRDLYSHQRCFDTSYAEFCREMLPLQSLPLTMSRLRELIDYTTAYKLKKRRPSSAHNYCEIHLGINKNLSNRITYQDSIIRPLHCPEFEKELPAIMRKLRKDVAAQERLVHKNLKKNA